MRQIEQREPDLTLEPTGEETKKTDGIGRGDPNLGRYLRDMSKHPRLEPSIQTSKLKSYIEAKENNDPKADELRRELIEANLPLAMSIAKKYQRVRPDISLSDFIQAGNIGLIRAIDSFDLEKGGERKALSTHATWLIKNEILALIANQNPIKLNSDTKNQIKKIEKAIDSPLTDFRNSEDYDEWLDKLSQKTGFPPVTLKRVVEAQKIKEPISLNRSLLDNSMAGSDGNLLDVIKNSNVAPPDQIIFEQEKKQLIEELISKINHPKQEEALRLRFDLGGKRGYYPTLEEIGKEMRISHERVRQILETAMEKLRHPKHRELREKLRPFLEDYK